MRFSFGSRPVGVTALAAVIAAAAGAFAVGAGAGQSDARSGSTSGTGTGAPPETGASMTSPAAPARASRPDSFTGSIRDGSGRYAHDTGTVSIYLHFGSSSSQTRSGHLTIRGRRCRQSVGCAALRGRLHGTLTATAGGTPDTGKSFRLQASGMIAPLGHLTATGTVRGTGFIRNGHESLEMSLVGARGQLSVTALSKPVSGFTSP